MKHFISLLGIVGVITVFSACSGDDAPEPVNPDNSATTISSSSVAAAPQETSSATDITTSSPDASTPASSSSKAKKDKDPAVVMTTRVTIDTGATSFDDPYFSSGIFCWTEGCEEWASSASGPDIPPEDSITLSSDVPAQLNMDTPPVIEGLVMTDMRDTQKYDLRDVNGTLWTAKNLNISLNGSNCYGGNANNCKEMGRLYTLSAAKNACPVGWKLPSRADFEAARSLTDFWKYGGRGKDGNEDFMGEMGFYWLDASEEVQEGDKISDVCSNTSCAMIFVIDAPGYGDEESKFQHDSQAKGFSVRCVQAK
ncbi:MAG: hypothetical protein J6U20_02195 [Fibrobacter sp.]|nr:hypothetical protein [Fibrobacter sp.]